MCEHEFLLSDLKVGQFFKTIATGRICSYVETYKVLKIEKNVSGVKVCVHNDMFAAYTLRAKRILGIDFEVVEEAK